MYSPMILEEFCQPATNVWCHGNRQADDKILQQADDKISQQADDKILQQTDDKILQQANDNQCWGRLYSYSGKIKKQKIQNPDPVNPLILELSRRLKAELNHASRRYPVKVIKQISPKYTIRKLPKSKVYSIFNHTIIS